MPYIEIDTSLLRDIKIHKLPPRIFKTWIKLACLIAEADGYAIKYQEDRLAFSLNMTNKNLVRQLEELVAFGLVDIDPKLGVILNRGDLILTQND